MPRHAKRMEALRHAVLETAGESDPALRRRIADHDFEGIDPSLADYLDNVLHHAYRVTDENVAALLEQGLSEDEVFELTLAAALGAGWKRYERAMGALRESA